MRYDPSKNIPTSSSSAEEWVAWHKSLRRWFSREEANYHWVRFWNQRSGAGSDADVHSLRRYMQDQGVNVVTDTGGDITDALMKAGNWIGSGMQITRVILIGSVVLVMGLVTFYVVTQIRRGKTAGEMAMDVASIRTGGVKPLAMSNKTQLIQR